MFRSIENLCSGPKFCPSHATVRTLKSDFVTKWRPSLTCEDSLARWAQVFQGVNRSFEIPQQTWAYSTLLGVSDIIRKCLRKLFH